MSRKGKQRKIRGDSKLHSLPPARRAELRDLLLGGAKYREAKAWLLETCGETTTGAALTNFWVTECQPVRDEETSLTATVADGIIQRIGSTDWDAATEELMKQTTFELLNGQEVDPKTKAAYVREWVKIRAAKESEAKTKAAAQSKQEAGIDALVDAVKGDKEAEELLRKLNERLAAKGGRE